MDQPTDAVLGLIALLDEQRWEIAAVWAHAIRREMPDTVYGQSPVEEIRDNNLLSIGLLKDILLGADSLPPEWENLPQLSVYLRHGVRVGEIMAAARLLRSVLIPLVCAAFPPAVPGTAEAMVRLEAGVDRFVALIGEMMAVQTTQYLEEQHRRTGLMLGMARAASANLELENVLRETVAGIAAAVGAGHGLMVLIGEGGSDGAVSAVTGEFPPQVADALREAMQRSFSLQHTVLVRPAVEKKQPVICPDVRSDPILRANALLQGVRSLLGVPCVLNERVLGVALVATYDAPRTFTEEEVDLALGVANVAAPAIENARLYKKVEELAVVEERARLAQEMHDNLAQTLGAMQFYVSLTSDLLAQQEPTRQQLSQAQAGLSVLHDMIDQAHVDVREAIFNLRSMASLQMCGLAALQTYLAAYEQRYGLTVQLQADPEAADVLVGAAGVQTFRILQEALTNVRKHGKTCCAQVYLERDGPWVRIGVQDEGQGFDPATVQDQDPRGFGLQVMRERAAKVGGSLSIESQPGQGTRLVLSVPYPQQRRPT